MTIDRKTIEIMFENLARKAQTRLKRAAKLIVEAKKGEARWWRFWEAARICMRG